MASKALKSRRGTALLALHLLLVGYSLSGICSKLASGQPFLSLGFIFWYGMVIVILGVYAIGWQQVIKRLPLTYAYANRAVTVVWGMVWGVLVFREQLNAFKVAGGLVVLAGVALYALSEGDAGNAADADMDTSASNSETEAAHE